jgi:hypothetical protein
MEFPLASTYVCPGAASMYKGVNASVADVFGPCVHWYAFVGHEEGDPG